MAHTSDQIAVPTAGTQVLSVATIMEQVRLVAPHGR